jgi:hypothetical protein
MSRDRKKQQKKKKREQKNIEKERYAERVEKERRHKDQYPKIFFDSANGDPEFVELVRSALATVDFDNAETFTELERRFYKLIREHGVSHAMKWADELFRSNTEPGKSHHVVMSELEFGFGNRLLDRIPEATRRKWMPYNDVHVAYDGYDIILRFSSLLSEKGEGGRIYYSRRKPTVEFDEKQWTVGFSRHAIERICQRINPRYTQYAAAGDVHAWFANCVYFEPVMLHGNQPAFRLYGMCSNPGYLAYSTYVMNIFGEENVVPSKGECYYRVGYCPVVFEKDFAKAKTFLFPGYSGTPEFGLILTANLSRSERERMIQEARNLDANDVLLSFNDETIKWFHDNGVPQVVQIKERVFYRLGS